MNAKGVYIGILCILIILILGVNETFVWTNPDYASRRLGSNCQIRSLPNCLVEDPRRPGTCLKCILDDGTGQDRQPFIPKNFDDLPNRGKGGCELNTRNPGVDDYPDPPTNYCTPEPGDFDRAALDKLGNQGKGGCANLEPDAGYKGASRLTTSRTLNSNNEQWCLGGEESYRFGYQREKWADWTGECIQKDYYKTRCILPVATLKEWVQNKRVINGIDFSIIDELPDTGTLYGKYHKAWKGARYNC